VQRVIALAKPARGKPVDLTDDALKLIVAQENNASASLITGVDTAFTVARSTSS
jgi:hypothetical protein